VTSARRSPSLPDLPTVAEAGVPGYEAIAWYGVLVPARTPEAIVSRLNHDIASVMKMHDVEARVEGVGANATTSTPAQFAALLKNDIARWAKVVHALKLQVN
jgi:tripartite-type tricarboxylate transporter receptor subunit TctC